MHTYIQKALLKDVWNEMRRVSMSFNEYGSVLFDPEVLESNPGSGEERGERACTSQPVEHPSTTKS